MPCQCAGSLRRSLDLMVSLVLLRHFLIKTSGQALESIAVEHFALYFLAVVFESLRPSGSYHRGSPADVLNMPRVFGQNQWGRDWQISISPEDSDRILLSPSLLNFAVIIVDHFSASFETLTELLSKLICGVVLTTKNEEGSAT